MYLLSLRLKAPSLSVLQYGWLNYKKKTPLHHSCQRCQIAQRYCDSVHVEFSGKVRHDAQIHAKQPWNSLLLQDPASSPSYKFVSFTSSTSEMHFDFPDINECVLCIRSNKANSQIILIIILTDVLFRRISYGSQQTVTIQKRRGCESTVNSGNQFQTST